MFEITILWIFLYTTVAKWKGRNQVQVCYAHVRYVSALLCFCLFVVNWTRKEISISRKFLNTHKIRCQAWWAYRAAVWRYPGHVQIYLPKAAQPSLERWQDRFTHVGGNQPKTGLTWLYTETLCRITYE